MKTRALILPALLIVAALTPARAEVLLYAQRLDAVHVNVFRPLGARATETTGPEVSMYFGKLDVLADPNGWGYPEEGGCVDIFNAGRLDSGCGTLRVRADGVMGVTEVEGTIQSTGYSYDPDNGFQELGPSQIEVDLVVTGTGAIELSPFTTYAVGVCGLPPDTQGVFVDGRPELQREASMSGSLVSATVGAIDPGTLPSLLVQASQLLVGACL